MSNSHKIHIEFPGRILFVGFGSIGQGALPLVLRHVGIAPERITIVTAEDKGADEAAKYGIK
jgi:homospermidine synthase